MWLPWSVGSLCTVGGGYSSGYATVTTLLNMCAQGDHMNPHPGYKDHIKVQYTHTLYRTNN